VQVKVVAGDLPAAPRASDQRPAGYLEIFRATRRFQRFAPLGFFSYGGMIGIQSLWAGPWLVNVAGRTPVQAAGGLFLLNVSMLLAFMSWGIVVPRLYAAGWTAQRLVSAGLPIAMAALGLALFSARKPVPRTGPRSASPAPSARWRSRPSGRLPGASGRPCLVGLQPGHLRRRLRPAMGNRHRHRPVDRGRLGHPVGVSRGLCVVGMLLCAVLPVVFVAGRPHGERETQFHLTNCR
jgi:hypothetical protein